MGTGDRFGQQGPVQLSAITEAARHGIIVTPVWNKSNREHLFTGSRPEDVRAEAEAAVRMSGYAGSYFVDADHINLDTVDRFIECSDFFTIDVASYIGKRAPDDRIAGFVDSCKKYRHGVKVPGIKHGLPSSEKQIAGIAEKYLQAARKAGEIYRRISENKNDGSFVVEVSIDEVMQAQSPVEIFFILKMLKDESIPLQTIAPKFTGRFNKGIDYSGDILEFSREFEDDVLVVSHASEEFGFPDTLKISVHSGSDKFSIYPVIKGILQKHNKGIHLKTSGTTWLEEAGGLARAGGEGLEFMRNLYALSVENLNDLRAPYSDVISVRHEYLPAADEVMQWNGSRFANSIRNDMGNKDYNPDMRQLMHIAYKLVTHDLAQYLDLVRTHRDIISQGVFENLYNRHITRVFPPM